MIVRFLRRYVGGIHLPGTNAAVYLRSIILCPQLVLNVQTSPTTVYEERADWVEKAVPSGNGRSDQTGGGPSVPVCVG
jgi:hypothetical protein